MTRVISEHEMYMGIADLVSHRSNDPNTKVGVCIGNAGRIVGVGWNGWPNGFSEDAWPWDDIADCPLDTKYPYVLHAELRAILSVSREDLVNAVMYCTLPPCNECSKVIIQSRIRTVIYKGEWRDTVYHIAGNKLLTHAQSGVGLLHYDQLIRNHEIIIKWKASKVKS